MIPSLSELEFDALTELVNMGVGRSAVGLRQLVGHQVLLQVPKVLLVPRLAAIEMLRRRESGPLVGVRQYFAGSVRGKAILIFPDDKSLDLVRAVVGPVSEQELIALHPEALTEIGNIVLGNCLASIANLLEQTFTLSLPEITRGGAANILGEPSSGSAHETVIFLYVDFTIDGMQITGYLAVVTDIPSFSNLKKLLAEFIYRAG